MNNMNHIILNDIHYRPFLVQITDIIQVIPVFDDDRPSGNRYMLSRPSPYHTEAIEIQESPEQVFELIKQAKDLR